jgi:hypothetical protein
MAHDQPSQADGEPQDAPGPPIALDDFASSEIPDLESSWVPTSHQPLAPSKEEQIQEVAEQPQTVAEQPQEVAEPPIAHHCAMCTYPACVKPVGAALDEPVHDASVSLDLNIGRSKTPTDHILQEHASPAVLQDFIHPEYNGPDLFARLSPEIREMIFALVYAHADIFAGVQGSCTCGDEEYNGPHEVSRTESPVLVRKIPGTVKGSRGTRSWGGHYSRPYEVHDLDEWNEEVEVEAQVLSPINSLLFVNKQTYLEALPQLYLNTTFFFDDWRDAHKFAATVGHANLGLIRAVEVFSDRDRLTYSTSKLTSFIVARMPNIEHLTVSFWNENTINLETDEWDGTSYRCSELERALLQFVSLKRLRKVDVKIIWEITYNTWGCADNTTTKKAVEEMILTGDRGILDRAKEAELRGLGDFAGDILESISETVDRSGLSKEWWLKRLAL